MSFLVNFAVVDDHQNGSGQIVNNANVTNITDTMAMPSMYSWRRQLLPGQANVRFLL